MKELITARLQLTPFSIEDFERFVTEMLVDPRVVQHFHSYDPEAGTDELRKQARVDFWDHFVESREATGLEIWAAYSLERANDFIGWAGLLRTSVSQEQIGPELQYMIAGDAHGHGYATELASAVLDHASRSLSIKDVIAVVDIPNKGSIRVLEKLGFNRVGQIAAYGSDEMLLFDKTLEHTL